MVNEKQYKGTTTVGLVCKNGVILASEKRATMGYLIASKDAQKIYQIDDMIGMTTAGGVGDAQTLVRIMTVESKLYKMRRQEPMTVSATATLLSNILNAHRYYPYFVQLLVGGVDKRGPGLFSLDALGGQIREMKAVSTGSGSPFAYGVLEDRYDESISNEEGISLAIRSLNSAMKRDAASGNGISIVEIIKDQYRQLEEKEIEKIQKSL